jgi:multiple sugar transport system permease protein
MRRRLGTLALYGPLTVLAAIFLVPFYLIVRTAVMTIPQSTSLTWQWFPTSVTQGNFATLFSDPSAPMASGLVNSAIISTFTLVFSILFSSMAGYALARIPVRGRNLVLYAVIATLMIPGAVTFVPTYIVVGSLGGVNTLWGIIVPGLFNAFSTFLFRQFYLRFPVEIEEAGKIDGLGYSRVYWHLLLPNSKGIMVALGLLAFMESWNSFLWPLVIGQNPSDYTVQLVISTFLTEQGINLPELFAGACIAVLPVVVVFLIMQRYIVQGVTMTGIRG